jgi:hypothetical protein
MNARSTNRATFGTEKTGAPNTGNPFAGFRARLARFTGLHGADKVSVPFLYRFLTVFAALFWFGPWLSITCKEPEPKRYSFHPGRLLLRELIQPLGLTVYRVAKDSGIPQSTLANVFYSCGEWVVGPTLGRNVDFKNIGVACALSI